MDFGICTQLENGALLKAHGWSYVEPSVQDLLQGTVEDAAWNGPARMRSAPLPAYAANMLVPGQLKITGPEVDLPALQHYVTRVVHRAAMLGIRVLVFGSGVARRVPDGFDKVLATAQIADFLRVAAKSAAQWDVTIVIEPLSQGECNILNTYLETAKVCRAVGQRNIRCLVDSYHMWLENEPLENVAAHADLLAHVHVADKDGRLPPGMSGTAHYHGLFALLKKIRYGGNISVEAKWPDLPSQASAVLYFLQRSWNAA